MTTQGHPFYILSLDGGGSLGVYTLGVLRRVEKLLLNQRSDLSIYKKFDLIYGTSTGAIISCLLALGKSVDEVDKLYSKYIPRIMMPRSAAARSSMLRACAYSEDVFGDKLFNSLEFKSMVGVVCTNFETKQPRIFKSNSTLFQSDSGLGEGFGCSIADAVISSCSAAPFFEQHMVSTGEIKGGVLFDGGFVANNPTLFAITDAVQALGVDRSRIKVLSIGVGSYPSQSTGAMEKILRKIQPVSSALELFGDTLAANNNTIQVLRKILFPDVQVLRISRSTIDPDYSTNLLESDERKLSLIRRFGEDLGIDEMGDLNDFL